MNKNLPFRDFLQRSKLFRSDNRFVSITTSEWLSCKKVAPQHREERARENMALFSFESFGGIERFDPQVREERARENFGSCLA